MNWTEIEKRLTKLGLTRAQFNSNKAECIAAIYNTLQEQGKNIPNVVIAAYNEIAAKQAKKAAKQASYEAEEAINKDLFNGKLKFIVKASNERVVATECESNIELLKELGFKEGATSKASYGYYETTTTYSTIWTKNNITVVLEEIEKGYGEGAKKASAWRN